MSELEDQLKTSIEEKLKWDSRVDFSSIDLKVDEGTVKVMGKSPSLYEKKIVTQDIKEVPGVIDVENNLDVKYPPLPEQEQYNDEDLKKNVKIALELNVSIDATQIEVKVFNGIATLEGSVDAYWKKEIAEDVVSEVSGIIDVINKIIIIPTEDLIDQKIAENIMATVDRFYNLDPDEIDLQVEEGQVKIMGKVDDWKAYQAAMDAIRFTAGVKDIEDELEIKVM